MDYIITSRTETANVFCKVLGAYESYMKKNFLRNHKNLYVIKGVFLRDITEEHKTDIHL